MLALPDLQKAFAGYLAGGDGSELALSICGDSIPAAARLRIHRHHVQQSLASALATTFPTVQALVGGEFFGVVATAFVAGNLPDQPVLAEYGAALPDFVRDYGPLQNLPYLADVARLDWALNVAFHSPDGPRLSTTALQDMAPDQLVALTLVLAPGSALVQSIYPIDRIWRACQPDSDDSPVDLAEGSASLLVLRGGDDATFVALDAAEAAFVAEIRGGAPLGVAAEAGLATGGAFDLAKCFERLLALQAFAALQ